MPRNLYPPSAGPVRPAGEVLLQFIQRAQLALVYSRRREGRLPLHDSFRLTLGARSGWTTPVSSENGAWRNKRLQPTVYVRDGNNEQNA
jgi:hypothetical protein